MLSARFIDLASTVCTRGRTALVNVIGSFNSDITVTNLDNGGK